MLKKPQYFSDQIKKVIKASSFEVIKGDYVYVQVKNVPKLDKHLMVIKDSDEITVVTQKENLGNLDLIEKNKSLWRLISINISTAFYCVGFIATLSQALAKAKIDIMVFPTYSKDYLVVEDKSLNKAIKVLLFLGFKKIN